METLTGTTTLAEEGFLTTGGVFLNRFDALMHAYDCGQISQVTKWYKDENEENELNSEDLY